MNPASPAQWPTNSQMTIPYMKKTVTVELGAAAS